MSIGFLCLVCPAVTNMEVGRQEKKWPDTPQTGPIYQQLSRSCLHACTSLVCVLKVYKHWVLWCRVLQHWALF